MLRQCEKLMNRESAAKKKARDAQKALDAKVLARYPKLSEEEVKALVVDDKWLATVEADVQAELDLVKRRIAERVGELEERYGDALPQLLELASSLEERVANHLEQMGINRVGISWN